MATDPDLLNRKLAELAFHYIAAGSGSQASEVMAEMHDLVDQEPGDYYIVFEKLCFYIAEHNSMYLEPLSMDEALAWLNEQ